MAKSPKKSRRGGRRSPKKSNKGVKKIISKEVKEVSEQPPSHAPEIHEAEDVQDLPEAVVSDKPDDVLSAKEMLTQFFAELNPDIHGNAWSLSQLPEQEFIFGKVASMFAANGQFADEVETNFGIVWKADEIWARSLLAGEIKPPEPEPEAVIEPEAAMEAEETPMEAEAPKEPEAAEDPEVDLAATAEITVDETKETEVVAPVSEEPFVQEFTAVQEPIVAEEPAVIEQLPMVIDKENATNILEDAVKMPFAKQLGEQQSPMHMSAMEGLAPKDVNVQPIDVQPMDLA